MRLGIDVGGTFTDLVLIDDDSGKIHYTKTLTTPHDLAEGVLAGIDKILDEAGAAMSDVDYIVHGTTIGTNALIERKGARVGLITTAGFRDVLEIARIERPDGGLYDMNVDLPAPLVPRYLRLEAAERIGAAGEVVRALDPQSVVQAVDAFKAAGVEAIAVSLLFSFRNPAHERQVREICEELYPEAPVTTSSEIAPEFREYERTSTTVINAYLLPVSGRYLEALVRRLREHYGKVDLRIMQASGGAMTAAAAQSRAVHMVNSGPAGGALATALFGRLAGEERIIGVDMGGTSFDISLIVGGRPRVKSEGEFEGYPVKMPLIDVEGIGAGGGSLAWVDAGGALNVGPQSAGAAPGPACYGAGGTRPAVTDANLVLGRLNAGYFLGGEMQLDVARARAAIEEHVARPLGLSVEEAAAGIIRVVNANMVRGIAVNSTQKGYDLREFALLAFGGAGPLHAVELAEELSMPRVIVPPFCSTFSAFGAVASPVRHDYVQTVALGQAQVTPEALQSVFAALEKQARRQLAEEHVAPGAMIMERYADVRYEGQSYELTIPMRGGRPVSAVDVTALIADFHAHHRRVYAYGDPNEAVEVISLRVAAIGATPDVRLRKRAARKAAPAPRPKARRPVYFHGRGYKPTDVYERDGLRAGQTFAGPCLIEERTSTTVVPPGWTGHVDGVGNLVLARTVRARKKVGAPLAGAQSRPARAPGRA
jgi:N-methylhydantoinase A